jgi:hypothetical protein
MRKLLLVVAFALVAAPVSAQRYDMPYPVQAYLDAPAQGQRVSQGVMFGGWAFNWRTCRHVASVQLWRVNLATREVALVPSTTYWGPRPDVQAYAVWGGCATAEVALGFTVIPHEAQPFGAWRYILLATDLQRDPDSINWTAQMTRDVLVQ